VQELNNIQINENSRIITLDKKDLYVNLSIKNILCITEFWFNKCNQDHITIEQTMHLLEVILKENYFQYSNQFYQPDKGTVMGSLISSALAEIYLQYLEEMYLKHCLENKEITYCKRYVDVILIIFDQNKTCEDTIHNIMNNNDEHLEFKTSRDDNKTIYCLDLSSNRNTNNVDLNIYRKRAYINTIHIYKWPTNCTFNYIF